MINPESVNPTNFMVKGVLYNDGYFSIAWTDDEEGNVHIGMRWNGENGDDVGYPKLFNNPVWFFISEDLYFPIAKAILGIENSKKNELFKVLDRLTP